ncbi:MAG: DUF2460 domain-containing protein [Porticoccaceae bacterium]|nr:DUF2460 domain-containing protein [Porticoccaceae bacterium]
MRFIDELFPVEVDRRGGFGAGVRFANDVTTDASGNMYVSTRHPYPVFRCDLSFSARQAPFVIQEIWDLLHRAGGGAAAFRVRSALEYSTNNYRDTPTAADQDCIAIDDGAGTYQIVRWYGSPGTSTFRRRIRKPRAGSIVVGIRAANGITYPISAFTADYTRGIITLSANKQRSITGITQAAQAVITVGAAHGIVTGDSVVIRNVAGMTEINGRRAAVLSTTSTTITVGIDSTGFTAYDSGGEVNTRPQVGEAITAGCYFDLPMTLDGTLPDLDWTNWEEISASLTLVEVLNPDPQ